MPARAEQLPNPSQVSFLIRFWQTDQGLPNNTINAITQTREGYLWLGTDNGLVRFSGVHCQVFGLHDGLGSLQISALLEDRHGALWIGTAGGGLSRMVNGTIETFTIKDGLLANSIQALLETTNGEVWVGSPSGLSRWRNEKFEPIASNLGSFYVYDMAKDRQGDIWVATLHNGLLRFRGEQVLTVPGPVGTAEFNPRCVLVDIKDRVWVALREWGVQGAKYIACYENGNWTRYGPKEGLPSIVLNRLAQSPDGTIWAGSMNDGLYYLQNDRFNALQRRNGLPDNAILALFSDRQFLWAGTQSGGLCRIGPKKLSVYHAMEGLSECQLRSLAETTNGDLWLGTYGQGLYRWQGEQIEQLLGNEFHEHVIAEALLGGRDGSLWWGAGPTLYQWKNGEMLSRHEEGWLAGDRVWSLCEDRAGGMWVGTYNGQLQFLQQGKFTPVKGLPARPITALTQEADGTLWIGSLGGGLARLQNGKITTITTKDGLRSDLIRALHLDASGILWIGTDGGGLGRWFHGKLAVLTTQQGLMDDTVLQILEDDDGGLWLGGNRGICRIYKRVLNEVATGQTTTLNSLVIGRTDGMLSEACVGNFGAAVKTHDGRLCFSTAKGIVVINSRQQIKKLAPPLVLLEGMFVDGRALMNQPLPAGAPWAAAPPTSLEIPPGRHSLEFHYSGIHYDAPEKIRFKYQLEGFDADWIDAGNERTAHYSYVPPGSYRFLVKASTGNDLWISSATEQFLIVQAFFWQTIWFKVALTGLGLGLGGWSIRYVERRRYKARLKRLEQEQAMTNERERIARDLHDELGSSLTYISMAVSNLGRSREHDAQRLKSKLEKISNFAVRTARSLDEIVWAVNPRNDSLRSLVEYLTQLARELAEDTGIRCRFQIQEDLPQLPLPPDIRHNLFLMVKEALTNAIKHAHATEMLFGAKLDGHQLEILIQDNGTGFDPATMEADGDRNGLKNMRLRAASLGGRFAVETKPGAGTIIRLSLAFPNQTSKSA